MRACSPITAGSRSPPSSGSGSRRCSASPPTTPASPTTPSSARRRRIRRVGIAARYAQLPAGSRGLRTRPRAALGLGRGAPIPALGRPWRFRFRPRAAARHRACRGARSGRGPGVRGRAIGAHRAPASLESSRRAAAIAFHATRHLRRRATHSLPRRSPHLVASVRKSNVTRPGRTRAAAGPAGASSSASAMRTRQSPTGPR
jgi:hypothetical protein